MFEVDYWLFTADAVYLTNLIDSCNLANFCIVFFTGFRYDLHVALASSFNPIDS